MELPIGFQARRAGFRQRFGEIAVDDLLEKTIADVETSPALEDTLRWTSRAGEDGRALSRFQMRPPALADLGLTREVIDFATGKPLRKANGEKIFEWTGKWNIFSDEDFLNNPKAQRAASYGCARQNQRDEAPQPYRWHDGSWQAAAE
ncbi:MAG: hypothetical protein FJX56_01170 [Alphaproteobacteria bacterium]|nr:hypothetical protein [Alphaproteobacteria bacterium]